MFEKNHKKSHLDFYAKMIWIYMFRLFLKYLIFTSKIAKNTKLIFDGKFILKKNLKN